MKFEELKSKVETITEQYQTDPELIAELVQFKAQFYKYSLKNTLAIRAQNPYAMFVDSFLGWRKRGYSVKKGEKAIGIWVPIRTTTFYRAAESRTVKISEATREEKQQIARKELETKSHLSFRIGKVFDISQTTCPSEDYPSIFAMGYEDIQHRALFDMLSEFAKKTKFSVNIQDVHSIGLGGYYNPDNDAIVISDKLKDTRRLSVLCHELAHGLMHKTSTQPKEVLEFEAEALAIMLLYRMDLPVEDVNRRYVTEYYQKIDTKEFSLDDSFARIQKAYTFVVNGLEKELQQLAPEQTISYQKEMQAQRAVNENFMQALR